MTDISSFYLKTKQEFTSTFIESYVPYNTQYIPQTSDKPITETVVSPISSFGKDNSSMETFRPRSFSAPADNLPEIFQVQEKNHFQAVQSENSNPSITNITNHYQHQDNLSNHHYTHNHHSNHHNQHHHQTHNHNLHLNHHHHAPIHTFTPIVFPKQRIFECQREVESSPPKNNIVIVLSNNSNQYRVKGILKKKFSISKNLHPVQDSSNFSPKKTHPVSDFSSQNTIEDRSSSPSKLSNKNILKDSIYLQQNHPQHAISVPKLTVPEQLLPQSNSPLHKTKLVSQRSSSLHGSKRVHFSPKNLTFSFEDSFTTADDSDSESLDQSSNEHSFSVGNTAKISAPSTNLNQQNSFYLQINQIKTIPEIEVKSSPNQPQAQSVQPQQNQTEGSSKSASPLLALFKDQQISKRAKIYFQPQENGNQQPHYAQIKLN